MPASQPRQRQPDLSADFRLPRGDGVKCSLHSASQALDETAQLFASTRMPQFAQRLGFDLPDALAGHFEVLSDFLERMIGGLADAESFAQHFFFPRRQRLQCAVDLALQVVADGRFQRRDRLLVLDEVAQMAVFFLADRSFERNRFARDLQNLSHFVERQIHALGDFLRRRFAAELLHQMAGSPDQLIDRFDHVHGNADRPGLVRNRARDRLTDPPRRIGTEFVPALVLEFVHRLHESDIAFLNQIQELQARGSCTSWRC